MRTAVDLGNQKAEGVNCPPEENLPHPDCKLAEHTKSAWECHLAASLPGAAESEQQENLP